MNKKVMIGSLIIIGAVLALLIFATPGATGVEVTVGDIIAEPERFEDRFIKVSGSLVRGSVNWNPQETTLRFQVEHEGAVMDVRHRGIRPDNFDDDVIVILDGKYLVDEQVFVADRLSTRCPSKYEEEGGTHPDDYERSY
ncbi:cytochrome c maturation protein CcmE [Desulfuribacillus alkaliarsenatis]|uniref:Cytochrome c maturation protein CcmE n=1 Tax=Desulfuribacillus alkaliarsenatis TaxID=766136 RepID=A0A1E5FZU2_9FIRM|nr:cytochrome c maturation protein CcmE [Desulfuribacillus alkaliarsenatis]OEF96096.1 hypothetical protein BHF68_10200 [Desulfuribacillus alkaliarsenatis]